MKMSPAAGMAVAAKPPAPLPSFGGHREPAGGLALRTTGQLAIAPPDPVMQDWGTARRLNRTGHACGFPPVQQLRRAETGILRAGMAEGGRGERPDAPRDRSARAHPARLMDWGEDIAPRCSPFCLGEIGSRRERRHQKSG